MASNNLVSIRKIRESNVRADYSSYAGRGSFGDRWPAFHCEDPTQFFADVLEEECLEQEELLALMRKCSWDFPMLYWRIKLEDPQDIVTDEEEDEE
jgi:hypothetical protein